MDQQAKELEQNIPGATVTQVGEGIAVTFPSRNTLSVQLHRIPRRASRTSQQLATSLEKYPNSDILIVGHTTASAPTLTTLISRSVERWPPARTCSR
jgi:hypothetical protein